MTVPANEVRKATFIGDGVQTVFPYTFRIFKIEDMEVFLDDVIQTTGFNVTGAGNPAGGNVTFTVAPCVTVAVALVSNTTIEQPFDYVAGDKFPAETHEKGLDRVTVVVAESKESVARALKLPAGTSLINLIIGPIVPGQHTAWDSTGTILESVETTVGELVDVPVVLTSPQVNDLLVWSAGGGGQFVNLGTWSPEVFPNGFSELNAFVPDTVDNIAYTLTFNPAHINIPSQQWWFLQMPTTNLPNPTFEVDATGLGVLPFTTPDGVAVAAGAMVGGRNYIVMLNGPADAWHVLNIQTTVSQRKTTVFEAGGATVWTKTDGMNSAKISVTGTGAGGKSSDATDGDPGGGGAATAIKSLDISGITTAAITVPSDSAADTDGGDAVYDDTVNTITGGGGKTPIGAVGGIGGIPTGGDLNIPGQDGEDKQVTNNGGDGGGSFYGGGGKGAKVDIGGNGKMYGGGGGGAAQANNAGGAGKSGVIVIEESTEVLV